MIQTFFGADQLVAAPSAKTFFAALVIGLAFGFALERAGFGSSRRLAGIFYFRDMTVLRVMFTALITSMLGLGLVSTLGLIDVASQVHLLPTVYGAQAVGGLIFGVGFVLSGWCPGTAAVGAASGKLDALVFLLGALIGSIAFNETYGWTEGLRGEGQVLVAFGMAPTAFALLFTLAAIGAFYFAEWVERRTAGGGPYLHSRFLRAFSLGLGIAAVALAVLPAGQGAAAGGAALGPREAAEAALLRAIDAAEDHIEPEDLADRLMQGQPDLVLIDVRTPEEYAEFHVRGAENVPLAELPARLAPYKDRGLIVLYSNGMTHPAQARDSLARLGYGNVYMLTDGLEGFRERVLKPVSLRSEPLAPEQAERVRAWRSFFLAAEGRPVDETPAAHAARPAADPPGKLPGLVDTAWLAANLGRPDVKVID